LCCGTGGARPVRRAGSAGARRETGRAAQRRFAGLAKALPENRRRSRPGLHAGHRNGRRRCPSDP
nr:hypothetical protein [Tanacetum cinerariifolium]